MKTNQQAGILMCLAATAVMTIFGASAADPGPSRLVVTKTGAKPHPELQNPQFAPAAHAQSL